MIRWKITGDKTGQSNPFWPDPFLAIENEPVYTVQAKKWNPSRLVMGWRANGTTHLARPFFKKKIVFLKLDYLLNYWLEEKR